MKSLQKNLTRRYLIWAYKTTRESFERIERKTTQLTVDEYILKRLTKFSTPKGVVGKEYEGLVNDFKEYIANKKSDELKQKFNDDKKVSLASQYLYLKNRLSTIKDAIKYFLGPAELKKIEMMFESEFIQRIWQAKEH